MSAQIKQDLGTHAPRTRKCPIEHDRPRKRWGTTMGRAAMNNASSIAALTLIANSSLASAILAVRDSLPKS